MTDWADWIGREEVRTDRLDPGLFGRWLASFDRAAPADGAAPQSIHWCLCVPDTPTHMLGPDGHPARDADPASFLPPLPLPRRMWAGSAIRFLRPIQAGAAVSRVSRVASILEKQGRSGPLCFVEIDHSLSDAGGTLVEERQSLVYRAAAAEPAPADAPAPVPFDPSGWTAHRSLIPDETLLFRYSALTFNGHRIHYDAPYAIGQEGYRGLVVHGPLIASLLLDLAARTVGDNRLSAFTFRARSPSICGEALHLCLRRSESGLALAALAGDGRLVMEAEAAL